MKTPLVKKDLHSKKDYQDISFPSHIFVWILRLNAELLLLIILI